MKTRNLIVSVALMSACGGLFGQQVQESVISADEAAYNKLTKLVLPAGYATRPLSFKKDNSRVLYFSGIYSQDVWNCNQASSIWTMFTYEINYLRNLSSSLTENQYSPMAVYNLLNYGNPSQGVSYFDSWDLVKANGIPANPDFTAYSQNSQYWMTGYDKYYRGMKNRVDEVFAIDVGNPEGLLTLKHWLNDHLNGADIGGVANFQIGSGDMILSQIPLDKGFEEEGQYIITKYGPYVGHAMTFVGWNDSVRYDVNGDKKCTNNIDINGDGVVNMKDWEIGAMLVVNSWSAGWGNAGKIWVMDRLLAEHTSNGGIWNNAAMVVKPKKTYNPLLTIKTQVRYNQRNRIKIQAGVSADPNALLPEKVMDFPCFSYQGDTLPMQGFAAVNSDLIEIGLDITPLLNYIPANGQAKIFLEVLQKSPDTKGSGKVEGFTVMDYTNGTHTFVSPQSMVPIARNTVTRLAVSIDTRVNRPQIITEELPAGMVGLEYRFQLEADGTTGPYRYANPAFQYLEVPAQETISFSGGTKIITLPGTSSQVIDLPFSFPMYGTSYDQVTIMSDGGIVMGTKLVEYPYVIDTRLRFYQNKGVFPFFGTLYYPNANAGVTFEGTSAGAVIRWHAAADALGTQPLEFAAQLLPDGKILFHYGSMNVPAGMPWISGLSAGDNLSFYLMDHARSGLKQNTNFSMGLQDWPSWLSLSSLGDLKGIPDKPDTYTLPLRVTDWSGISNFKELTFTVSGGSGVGAVTVQNSIRVFPNPASDIIWFQGYTAKAGQLNLALYDLSGALVFSRQYSVSEGEVMIPLSAVKSLPTGIYLYRVGGVIENTGKIIRE